MKLKEKDFLRAVKDADRSFYLRAAAMAAEAQREKIASRRWLKIMKRTLKIAAAGAGMLAAVIGICIFAGVFAEQPDVPGTPAGSSLPVQFVDPEKFAENAGRNTKINVQFTDFIADDHPFAILNDGLTVNEQYLYSQSLNDSFRINLQTGKPEYLCAVTGCLHRQNDTKCEMYEKYPALFGVKDGVIQHESTKMVRFHEDWLRGDRSGTLFWKNSYYTDLDKEIDPTDPASAGRLLFLDGHYYVKTNNSLTRIDPETGEQSNPVISDSQIFTADGAGGCIWFTNEGMELLRWNPETGEKQKFADYAAFCVCNSAYVFYDRMTRNAEMETSQRSLMRRDLDGQNEVCILSDFRCFNGRVAVTEQSVYYYQDGSYADGQFLCGRLLRCGLDGSDLHEIPLDLTYSDGTHYRETTQTDIRLLNCKSCDAVFLLDTAFANDGMVEMDALFVVKKDTDDVQAIDLGKAQHNERRSW